MDTCVENIAPESIAHGKSASPAAPPSQPTSTEKRSWFPASWIGMGKSRTAETTTPHIVHVDVDAFFASVEQVLNPNLRGKPVLVGRGVVASASYEAKLRGVKTAMSFRDALRICPKAIVVPGQYEHYANFAERIRRILETYTPAVETASLDDFYLDFAGTERLYPDLEATLRRLQADILGQTGLSVSVGAGRTKVVASIASRLERPRGFRIVMPGTEEAFLAPLPVEKLHGIGHIHAGTLAERGVSTIGQLRLLPKAGPEGGFRRRDWRANLGTLSRAGRTRGPASFRAQIHFPRKHHRRRHHGHRIPRQSAGIFNRARRQDPARTWTPGTRHRSAAALCRPLFRATDPAPGAPHK